MKILNVFYDEVIFEENGEVFSHNRKNGENKKLDFDFNKLKTVYNDDVRLGLFYEKSIIGLTEIDMSSLSIPVVDNVLNAKSKHDLKSLLNKAYNMTETYSDKDDNLFYVFSKDLIVKHDIDDNVKSFKGNVYVNNGKFYINEDGRFIPVKQINNSRFTVVRNSFNVYKTRTFQRYETDLSQRITCCSNGISYFKYYGNYIVFNKDLYVAFDKIDKVYLVGLHSCLVVIGKEIILLDFETLEFKKLYTSDLNYIETTLTFKEIDYTALRYCFQKKADFFVRIHNLVASITDISKMNIDYTVDVELQEMTKGILVNKSNSKLGYIVDDNMEIIGTCIIQ